MCENLTEVTNTLEGILPKIGQSIKMPDGWLCCDYLLISEESGRVSATVEFCLIADGQEISNEDKQGERINA
jgi:hypothetical protein